MNMYGFLKYELTYLKLKQKITLRELVLSSALEVYSEEPWVITGGLVLDAEADVVASVSGIVISLA